MSGSPVGTVTALHDFSASDQHGLSFHQGDVIIVFQCLDSGWWDGSIGDARGWFPSNFTTKLNQSEPEDESSESSDSHAATTQEQALPKGWTLHENDYGIVFYFHAETKKVQLSPPEDASPVTPKKTSELAENWGEKKTPDGRVYYYNMVTNETTWKKPDVTGYGRKQSVSVEKFNQEEFDQKLVFDVSEKAGANKVSWNTISQGILGTISDLHEAVKLNKKDIFVNATKLVVKAVQVLLKATGTYETNSPHLAKSKILAANHREITENLSKLVLAAKLASGVWPPPDALSRMQQLAADIVHTLRAYIAACVELGIHVESAFDLPERRYMPVQKPQVAKKPAHLSTSLSAAAPVAAPVSASPPLVSKDTKTKVSFSPEVAALTQAPEIPKSPKPRLSVSFEATSQGVRSLLQAQAGTAERERHVTFAGADDETHEHVAAEDQTDTYRIADLDVYSKQVRSIIEILSESIKKTAVKRSTHFDGEAVFVNPVSKVVVVVGKIMTIADEIEGSEGNTELRTLKRGLHDSISGLVAAAKQASEPLAPPDALRQVMSSVQAVVSSVRQTVICAKRLVATKEQKENEAIIAKLDANERGIRRINSVEPNSEGMRADPMKRFDSVPNLSGTPPKKHVVFEDDSDDDDPAMSKRRPSKLANFFGESPPSRKLSKFFGAESSQLETLSQKPPAYMLPDYKANEIVFNMEGKVKGGTIAALVERLTQHDVVDTDYLATFLMTYKTFTSPPVLLDLVIKRFYLRPQVALSPEEEADFNEKKLSLIRLRVVNVLKMWIEASYEDMVDPGMFNTLLGFTNGDLKTQLKNPAEQLLKVIQKKATGTLSRKTAVSGQAPLPIVSKSLSANKLKFIDLDPLEIARQLTLMESRIFNAIEPSEFLGKAWSSPEAERTSIHIRQLIQQANMLTAFVVESILQEDSTKKRCEMTKHFLLVAEKCRTLNNFNSLMAILAGLSSAPIDRLKKTWAAVGNKAKAMLDSLRQTMNHSSNFVRYRETLHSVNPPCVPFLGVYLTDLTFIEDGNSDLLKGTTLINFDKRLKFVTVINEIRQYQAIQYCLQPVSIIENHLTERFRNAQSIDQLYDLSLKIEPREVDEGVLKMLSESSLD